MNDKKIDLVRAVLKKFPGTVIVKWGANMSWTAEDRVALLKAGQAGGNYLDAIGKTDLAKVTDEEWKYFIETIIREWETQAIPF